MAPVTKLGPLNDKEKAEFDNIRCDEIYSCKDVKKLMRMEAYFRDEGFPPTADAVANRLRELGQRAANAEVDPEQARLLAEEQARAAAEIAAWTAKQRQTDAALEAASRDLTSGSHNAAMPPVRMPVRLATEETKQSPASAATQAPAKSRGDSAVGTKTRSGREYYEAWEKKVEAVLAEADREDGGSPPATRLPAGAAASAASTAGLARSPELTNRLLELNRGASAAERLYLSGVEKAKGNDHFRAKDYAEAVEHYTLALGLRGAAGEASLFGNRAAAYIKLKMWDAAEQDASAALEADPKMFKCYMRRAMARLELGRLADAVADCDAALALQPGCKEAEGMRERAAKLLQEAGMKRMAIEEVDEEDEEEGDGQVSTGPEPQSSANGAAAPTAASASAPTAAPQSQRAAAQPAPAPAPRKKLVVVEESDSSDEGEKEEEQEAPPEQSKPPQPAEPDAVSGTVLAPEVVAVPLAALASPPAPALAAPAAAPAAIVPPSTSTPAAASAAPPTPAPSAAAKSVPASAATDVTVPAAAPPAAAAAVPPPPPLDLPPEPSPPAPTPSAKFDAAVEGLKQDGNSAFKGGNFVRAAQLYSDALELAPDLATLYLNRSMARLSSNLPSEALRDACQAVALDPQRYKAYNKRARAKAQLRLWAAAQEDMQRCLELVPAREEHIRGEVARELDRLAGHVAAASKRAAERAAAAAARGPQKVTKYARTGVTIEEHHDDEEESEEDKPLLPPDEAADWEAAAVRRLPRLRSRAEELRAGWLRERDAAAREAYKLELLTWQAAKERAEAAAAAAAAPAAATAEEAATATATAAEVAAAPAAASAPSPPPAPRALEDIKAEGNEHLNAKRFLQAEQCYQRCLQLDPANLPVRLNLLVLMNAMERWAEAEEGARKTLELIAASRDSLSPELQSNMRSKVHHRRAQALKAQGRLQEALEDLRAARALFGQSPTLDRELEEVGRRLLAEREAAAAATVGAQAAAGPAASASDAEAPATVGAQAQAAGKVEAPAGLLQTVVPAAAEEPAWPPEPAAASGTSASASHVPADGGAGGGAAQPVRRRMQVLVESDDSEDDGEEEEEEENEGNDAGSVSAPAPPVAPASPSHQAAASAAPATSAPLQTPTTHAPAPPTATTPSTAASAVPPTSGGAPAATSVKGGGGARAEVSGDPGDPEAAARLRDEGNRLYGVGNYVRAIDFYTRSIRACTHNPAAYCNRAFVYLHLCRPADALLDAEAAIEQSGGRYPKAQLRRAYALRDLGHVTEAMSAVQQLLDAAPGDAVLLEEMQRLQQMAAAQGAGPSSSGGRAAANGVTSSAAASSGGVANGGVRSAAAPATHAPPPVQAPPVRHRVVVEEVTSDSDEDEAVAEAPSKTAEPVARSNGNAASKAVNPPPTATAPPPCGSSVPPSAMQPSSAPVATTTSTADKATMSVADGPGRTTASPPAAAAAAAAAKPEQPALAAAAANGGGRGSVGGGRNSVEAAAAAKASAALAVAAKAPKKTKPPKNAHELEHALKSLAEHPAVRYEYLRSLDPASYAGVIKANLSTKMVQAIVEAARQAMQLPDGGDGADAGPAKPAAEDVDFALRSLECLTLVPRFDVTYGLCGKAMQENVRALAGSLAAAGQDVSLLKKSYKL